jgi:hypothetical protein
MTRVKRDLRDWCRKDGKKAFDELRKLALDNPDSWVRLAAVKLWIEYGYGKPLSAEGENPGAITQVRVITGERMGADRSGASPASSAVARPRSVRAARRAAFRIASDRPRAGCGTAVDGAVDGGAPDKRN